jgi:hypothetical protein
MSGEIVCVGFTGTQGGMSAAQRDEVTWKLKQMQATLVVHGDCIGSDAEFDAIAASLGIRREIYPGNIEEKRAHCETRGAVLVTKPMPPLKRNDLIVERVRLHSGVLLATPGTPWERLRSGTWATIRRAAGIAYVIAPNGEGKWR